MMKKLFKIYIIKINNYKYLLFIVIINYYYHYKYNNFKYYLY